MNILAVQWGKVSTVYEEVHVHGNMHVIVLSCKKYMETCIFCAFM